MHRFTISILSLFFSCSQPLYEWKSVYNGNFSGPDKPNAMALDGEGNIYVTGWSYGIEYDYATVKYDKDGNQIWVARYNGPGNGNDIPRDIKLDRKGNVYVTGASKGEKTGMDYVTLKYDRNGNQVWVARWTSKELYDDEASSLAVDRKGNVYVTGGAGGNFVTVKFDSSGKEVWVTRYKGPGTGDNWANDIALDREGNVYVTGNSSGKGTGFDYATLKYNSRGKRVWVARYDGPKSSWDRPSSIAVDPEGNVYVTGESKGKKTHFDCATVKYDSRGNQVWVARYNGPADSADGGNVIKLYGYMVFVGGVTKDTAAGLNYLVLRYDANGNTVWVKTYNSPKNGNDIVRAIDIDEKGNVWVTGESSGDYATVMYDTRGNQLWAHIFDGTAKNVDGAVAVKVDRFGNIYVTGGSSSKETGLDFVTLKYPARLFKGM